MFKKLRFFMAAALMLISAAASAQITTSAMSGKVIDSDNEAVIGATVQAIHTPSGTSYGTITNIDGRYSLQGMRAGGPYKVTISYVGYQSATYEDVTLSLGETYVLNHTMKESSELLDEVVISATATKFTTAKTGAAVNISNMQIANLPTVNRSISDIARLSPYANGMSFGGGDGRSTNFTVDGANFNNNFGLSDALPGGGNPISMDAIEEVQVVIAPFDVRQTNFIGGGINAITKSGTNTTKGTVYGYYRNQDMRGDKINGKSITKEGETRPAESREVYGFTLGGPIVKNKLFYFVNFEKENTPGQVIQYRANAGGEAEGGNISRTLASDMQFVQKYMKDKYSYDTGSYSDFPGDEGNMKILARVDWNINSANKLSVRYNYTKNTAWNAPNGNSSDTGNRLNGTYRSGLKSMAFANNMYSMDNKVQSISADLNSKISENLSNQALFTFSKIDDVRGSKSDPFPHVDIIMKDGDNWQPYMSLGYELFTWNNGVHNNIYNFKDDITYLAGAHKITAGLSYEHQFANNAYMRNGALYYRYAVDGAYNPAGNQAALEAALNGTPESFAITYGWGGQENPTAQVTFNQFGLYAQDEWDMTKNFKLTYGVRFDDLLFDNSDLATNKAILEYTFRDGQKIDTGAWPSNRIQVSPRVGFVWDVMGDQTLKFRGGTGLFQGRLPLVYFTNMPTNAGMVQNSVQFKSTWKDGDIVSINEKLHAFDGGMITDVKTALKDLSSSLPYNISDENHVAGGTMSGVDKNFHMPQIWKSSLAADYKLPTSFPMTVTGEFMFNKTIWGVVVDNINIVNPDNTWARFSGKDDRLIYPANYAINAGKNAPVLTNTREGYGYTANVTVNATPVKNLDIMAAYTRTESKEISGLPGSDPLSTWQGLITVDGPNQATLQRSQYVVPDKVIASVSYFFPFETMHGKGLHASLFYTGMTPYGNSYCYTNDMNGDGINNDLMYIPSKKGEINFVSSADEDAFFAFMEQDSYLKNHKGQYAEAYAARAPWVHRFDLRLAEDIAFKVGKSVHTFQVSFDAMNIGNMINSSWGVYKNNAICNSSRVLKYEGKDANNVPSFSMYQDKDGNYAAQSYDYYVNTDQCWKLQFGLRYYFN